MKTARQRAIVAIVAEYEVGTQGHLSRLLARRGHHVDQATLSRDLRELGVAKVADNGGRPRYRILGSAPAAPVGAGVLIRGVERAGNLLVVRTDPGDAPRVGLALDRSDLPSIAGTVAGDDTLLVVVREGQSPARLARMLKEMGRP